MECRGEGVVGLLSTVCGGLEGPIALATEQGPDALAQAKLDISDRQKAYLSVKRKFGQTAWRSAKRYRAGARYFLMNLDNQVLILFF